MNRHARLTALLVVALVLGSSAPALANGRWDSQVTGGGEFAAGGTMFELAVSSREAGDDVKGQFQYNRDDSTIDALSFHGTVECVEQGGSGVAIAGPINVQEGDQVASGDWVSVEVRSDGTGARVHSINPEAEGCGFSGRYPANLVEGSFSLR